MCVDQRFTSESSVADIVLRLTELERQNRRLKFCGVGLLAMIAAGSALGFQAGSRVISADELSARSVRAESITVPMARGGELRMDERGITLSAPGQPVGSRTNLVDHETRIEIGMDFDWTQETFLVPTPRIAVGRAGRDTAGNLKTRKAVVSPEGLHSGEWHTNNDKHDGRTDRDLIESLRRR